MPKRDKYETYANWRNIPKTDKIQHQKWQKPNHWMSCSWVSCLKSITNEPMATTLGTMSKMLFGNDSLLPVLPHYSLTSFTIRGMVNMNDDVTVSVCFPDLTMVSLHSSQTSAVFLPLVKILQIAQLSPSVMQSFCQNGQPAPVSSDRVSTQPQFI